MNDGAIVEELYAKDATSEKIMAAIFEVFSTKVRRKAKATH